MTRASIGSHFPMITETQKREEREDPHQEASALMREEKAREKKDQEGTPISVIMSDAEKGQIEENPPMRDATPEIAKIEESQEIEMKDALLTEMTEDSQEIEMKDALMIEMIEDSLEKEMKDALLTGMIEDSQEKEMRDARSIEMTEESQEKEMRDALMTGMIEDSQEKETKDALMTEMIEDSQEKEMRDAPSIEMIDTSQEMGRMRHQDSTRARDALMIDVHLEMGREGRRALQSHMGMTHSWQLRTGKKQQPIGFRARKASIMALKSDLPRCSVDDFNLGVIFSL